MSPDAKNSNMEKQFSNVFVFKWSSGLSGRISSLKGWSGIGRGFPRKWWSPHPWRWPRSDWMWHSGHQSGWQRWCLFLDWTWWSWRFFPTLMFLYILLNTCSKDTKFYSYKDNKVLFWKEFFSRFRHFKFWTEISLRSRPIQWGVTRCHVFVKTSKQTHRKLDWNRKFWSEIWSIRSKLLLMLLFMFVWRNLHHLSE